MSAYRNTLKSAVLNGFEISHFDDDCTVFSSEGLQVEVVYDNYSPSNKFLSATVIGTGRKLGSYRAVRQLLEA